MIATKMYPHASTPKEAVLRFLDHSEKHMELTSYDPNHPSRQYRHGHLPPIRRMERKLEELRAMQHRSLPNTMTAPSLGNNASYLDFRYSTVPMTTAAAQAHRKAGRKKTRKVQAASLVAAETDVAAASEDDSRESQ